MESQDRVFSPGKESTELIATSSSQSPSQASNQDYQVLLKRLKESGHRLRSDRAQPDILQKPSWFEQTLFENAKTVYAKHFMGINFAHLSGLLLLVRVNSIFKTLSATGKSDTVSRLFNRYYSTVVHVKTWYEGDIFEENSEAYRSLLIVRGMHNKVSSTLNDHANEINEFGQQATHSLSTNKSNKQQQQEQHNVETSKLINSEIEKQSSQLVQQQQQQQQRQQQQPPNQVAVVENGEDEVHISEYDIMITQFAFIGLIVTRAKNVGLLDDFNQRDLESLLHFWRVIGFYLGASEKYNLCSYDLCDLVGLCEAIIEVEYKQSISRNPLHSPPGIMSVNIVRSVKFIPMLTIYGIMQYLYELLGLDTTELSPKKNSFSSLSYILIRLVMSRLLAYRALRAFNNGLTRLSVYLVGKINDWFTNHLESKYGQELRL